MAKLTGFGQKRILMSLWQPLNPPPLLFSALGYLGLSFPQESGRDLVQKGFNNAQRIWH
jgi:hypothetical protein